MAGMQIPLESLNKRALFKIVLIYRTINRISKDPQLLGGIQQLPYFREKFPPLNSFRGNYSRKYGMWTKMDILYTIKPLSRGLSTDPHPPFLVHVVIECPLIHFGLGWSIAIDSIFYLVEFMINLNWAEICNKNPIEIIVSNELLSKT